MSGTYEKIDNQPSKHECTPPGFWSRWWHRVGIGTIWRCECGSRWEWKVDSMMWPYPSWVSLEWEAEGKRRLAATLGLRYEETIRG